MQYSTYQELLNHLRSDGEFISPSDISSNRQLITKELSNIQLKIDNFQQLLLDDSEVMYYERELDWYLRNCTQLKPLIITEMNDNEERRSLKTLSLELIKCINRCGRHSNYGKMCLCEKNINGITQFDWVTDRLRKDPRSRQAITFYNQSKYQYYSNVDFVCCLSQMFNIIDNKLNTTVNCRSNDIINSFRFDMIWWRVYQNIIKNSLKDIYPNLELGYMMCNIYSAHYYIKDEYKIDTINQLTKTNTFKSINEYYLK